MKTPFFSVIIPTISKVEDIRDTLRSIAQAQKSHHLEIILVNDCSGHDLTLATHFVPRIRLINIMNSSRQGPGKSRDIGVTVSNGDVICFVDSDDIIEIDYFDVLAESISKNPDYSSIQIGSRDLIVNHASDSQKYISATVRKTEAIPGQLSRPYLVSFLSGNLPCECWQIAVRKDFYKSYNLSFPEGIHEDIEYWFAISSKSSKNIFVDLPLYNKVRTKGSIVNTLSSYHIDCYFTALSNVISLASELDPGVVELTIVPILNVAGSRLRRIKNRSVMFIDPVAQIETSICESVKMLYFKHYEPSNSELADLLTFYAPKTRFQDEIMFLCKIIA